jgi:hypothetical protein
LDTDPEDLMTRIALLIVALALGTSLALADPGFRMTYPGGVPRVEIDGDWSLSRYSVWRAGALEGPWARVTEGEVLCTGQCFAQDYVARPGDVVWYRFDLLLPDATLESFGPYRVVISPQLARPIGVVVTPNPGHGPARVQLTLAGPPGSPAVEAEAALHDLQGRRVSSIHRGPLSVGSTTVSWNGRGDDGRELSAGVYLLRFTTADARRSITRIVRIR